jgi:hypothetical protein
MFMSECYWKNARRPLFKNGKATSGVYHKNWMERKKCLIRF